MDFGKEVICECGHNWHRHFVAGTKCLGSEECQCKKSQHAVYADFQELKLAAYKEALEKIVAKSEGWQGQNRVSKGGMYTEPPWWNLGDIAKAALVKFGGEK